MGIEKNLEKAAEMKTKLHSINLGKCYEYGWGV